MTIILMFILTYQMKEFLQLLCTTQLHNYNNSGSNSVPYPAPLPPFRLFRTR